MSGFITFYLPSEVGAILQLGQHVDLAYGDSTFLVEVMGIMHEQGQAKVTFRQIDLVEALWGAFEVPRQSISIPDRDAININWTAG